jgi:hypothetical protein
VGESHALTGDSIEIGRAHHRIARAAHREAVLLVGEYEYHVWPPRLRGARQGH